MLVAVIDQQIFLVVVVHLPAASVCGGFSMQERGFCSGRQPVVLTPPHSIIVPLQKALEERERYRPLHHCFAGFADRQPGAFVERSCLICSDGHKHPLCTKDNPRWWTGRSSRRLRRTCFRCWRRRQCFAGNQTCAVFLPLV